MTSILYDLDTEVKGLYIGLKRKELNDSYHPSEFEWGDGSNHTYQNWAPGEPTPWLEPCVEVYYMDPSAGMWNDLPCYVPKYALCQQVIAQTSAQNDHNFRYESCETSGYVKYRNNCYKTYDQSSALDWVSAERKCRSDHKNSGIVYIEDSYEHSFVRLLAMTQIKSIEMWIGLIARTNIQNVLKNIFKENH